MASFEFNDNIEKKSTTRRSIFLPDVTTVPNTTEIKTSDEQEEYLKTLKEEEKTWKQLYEDVKQRRRDLLHKLELREPQAIDYSLFNEEEMAYLNSGPDVAEFEKEAENFLQVVKTISCQCEEKKHDLKIKLELMDKECDNMLSKLINK